MFALTDEKMGKKIYINSPKKIAWGKRCSIQSEEQCTVMQVNLV